MKSYRAYVKAQRLRHPCLSNLCRFLSDSGSDRNICRISCLDFFHDKIEPIQRILDAKYLHLELQDLNADGVSEFTPDTCNRFDNLKGRRTEQNVPLGRIFIVEDLARDVVEVLGANLDIDPLFFASHVHTPERERATQTPDIALLPSRVRQQNYVNIHYQRTLVFPKPGSVRKLLRDTNVPRRVIILPSTKNIHIGLAQHCCSILLKFQKGKGWLGLVLVDPPITDRYSVLDRNQVQQSVNLPSELFLGGYEDFLTSPSFYENGDPRKAPVRGGLFEDLAYYWRIGSLDHFKAEAPTLLTISFYQLKIATAEWNIYLEFMRQNIKEYAYSNEYHPNFLHELDKLNSDLRALQTWRLRAMLSQQKIRAISRFITSQNDADAECWTSLVEDCNHLAASVEDCGRRLENMLPVVTSFVQIVDSRRSFAETANISRLTILALVFVPLTFVSSLFSMNVDTAPGGRYFWVYIVVAVPITLAVFLIARPPVEEVRSLRNRLKSLRQPALPF